MALPKYKDIIILTDISEIDKEILILQKKLFDLRMKRSSNQNIESHLFSHYKRRIAQLNFRKTVLENK